MLVKFKLVNDPSKVGFISGLVVRSSAIGLIYNLLKFVDPGKHFRSVPDVIDLSLGEVIRCGWQETDRTRRSYRHGSDDLFLRPIPQSHVVNDHPVSKWVLRGKYRSCTISIRGNQ
jgi:hypothetical protein